MAICQIVTSGEDVLTFGKFKGETIQYVLDNEPHYIIWLDDSGIVDMDVSILDEAYNLDDDEGGFEDMEERGDS